MRALTDLFATGAATLPEALRTLVVSPERDLEPGMTLRAAFTFRNHGGAPASEVRVRFNAALGLNYIAGSARLNGTAIADEPDGSPLLAHGGALAGDVAPGEECRVEIAYGVAGPLENGSLVTVQAAVAAREILPVGSNVVRLTARTAPELRNAPTGVAIEAPHDARPGDEAIVSVRVHNAGASSARAVVVTVPVPDGTTYVPNSARIGDQPSEPPPFAVPVLPAGATVIFTYRVRIDDPLPGGTLISASAQIASDETPAFALAPAGLAVRSAPAFGDEEELCSVEPARDVEPGARVTIRLRAVNTGSAAAERLGVALELPPGLLAVRGAARADGMPLRERRGVPSYGLGRLDARTSLEFTAEAVVASPMPDGAELPVRVRLSWWPAAGAPPARRVFERTVVVRSQPSFAPRTNAVRAVGASTVRPSEQVEARIVLTNGGSAPATDAVLQLHLDPAFDGVHVAEKNVRLPLLPGAGSGPVDSVELGTIGAYASRALTVRARIRSPYANGSEVCLGATLHARESGATPLGRTCWRVASGPLFSAERSTFEAISAARLRPNHLADVYLRLVNEGTDAARNLRLHIRLCAGAALESLDGARRDGTALLVPDLAALAETGLRLGVRLPRDLSRTRPGTVDGVLTADAMLPVPLRRLVIAAEGEPDFSAGTLCCQPAGVADAGETVEFALLLRNAGDGRADRVTIHPAPTEALLYLPNSTSVNGVPLRDAGGRAPFDCESGIVLRDVDPGVEATVRWREVLRNEASAGEPIVRIARVGYGNRREERIVAEALAVRALPSFASEVPGLPFGLAGALGPLPSVDPSSSVERLAESPQILRTLVAFEPARLARVAQLLDEARFGGLATHLFAVRAFLPDAVGGASDAALAAVRDGLGEALGRLFIKLRVPNYAVAARDVETPALRVAVQAFADAAAETEGEPTARTGVLVLSGSVSREAMQSVARRLREAAPATALPWLALAHCLPDETTAWCTYRDALVAALTDLADAPPGAFLDAVREGDQPALDAALDAARVALPATEPV